MFLCFMQFKGVGYKKADWHKKRRLLQEDGILSSIKKFLCMTFMPGVLVIIFSQPVMAFSESDVQAQVASVGKETVAGNVLVWFLCAVAFLKVSQKIDSFMSSLGINVGHTGGSMLAEAMIAARGIGVARNFAGGHFGGAHGSASVSGSVSGGSSGGFLSGGLAGVVSRKVTESAVKKVTKPKDSKAPGGIGGKEYEASVSKGGDFANGVIGTVAAGNIAVMGSMTGEKAVQALHSYMGHTALEEGASHVPDYSDVEIGGGRITGTETSEEHPEGIAFGMYHTAQYAAPEGDYTTVQATDGTTWYKQYATDAVDRTPYMAADGEIAYKESIVKRLPPVPRRKDRI